MKIWASIMALSKGETTIATKLSFPKLSYAQLERLISKSLDTHKAENIVTVRLAGKSDVADSMIIASGTSSRHVGALADHVVRTLKDVGYEHVPVEGLETGEWVLVDAGDVIVHIFRPEARSYYNLEKMWSLTLPETSELEAAY